MHNAFSFAILCVLGCFFFTKADYYLIQIFLFLVPCWSCFSSEYLFIRDVISIIHLLKDEIDENIVFCYMGLFIKIIAMSIINAYIILLSPLLGSVCIHKVSCSKYCLGVFKKQRLCDAFFLSIKRILSCHPWNKDFC